MWLPIAASVPSAFCCVPPSPLAPQLWRCLHMALSLRWKRAWGAGSARPCYVKAAIQHWWQQWQCVTSALAALALTSGIMHQTSGIKHQTSALAPTSGIRHQASGIRHQTSGIKHQTSVWHQHCHWHQHQECSGSVTCIAFNLFQGLCGLVLEHLMVPCQGEAWGEGEPDPRPIDDSSIVWVQWCSGRAVAVQSIYSCSVSGWRQCMAKAGFWCKESLRIRLKHLSVQ